MKKVMHFSWIVVLILVWAVAAKSAPRLTMPESSFNFGHVPQNSTISHVFWLYSTGDDTLRILSVSPG